MKLALEEARKAYLRGEVPIGAILLDAEKEIIGRGGNGPITLEDPTAHAEIIALRQGARTMRNYRLPNTTLYVTLEPCIMCLGAIISARVETIVFGAADPKAGALGGVLDLTKVFRFNHYIQVVGGILAKESAELLQGFFRKRRLEFKRTRAGEVPKRP